MRIQLAAAGIPGLTALLAIALMLPGCYFQAKTGCSKWATRVS